MRLAGFFSIAIFFSQFNQDITSYNILVQSIITSFNSPQDKPNIKLKPFKAVIYYLLSLVSIWSSVVFRGRY